MLFTSYGFLLFVAVLLVLYYLLPARCQWPLLLIGSYVFYAFSGPKYLLYLWAVTVIVYTAARLIDGNLTAQKAYLKEQKEALSKEDKKTYKASQKKIRFRYQVIAVLLCVGILAVVKYANFFISNVNTVAGAFGAGELSFLSIALPMGISFYTFQALSYLFDVVRGTVRAEQNLFRLGLFVGFFPQVVQGPISRYGELSKTLCGSHPFDARNVAFGAQRVLWGFFKKLVIADRIMPAVTTVTSDGQTYGGAYAFFGMLFYTIDLYADFTGGIDVTIGVAQMFGVDVMENFNLPYFSTSLKEYWRRWHISMCNWFRDYIFYPVSSSKGMQSLGKWARAHLGERVGRRLPVYVSSFVVWFTTGIWHGASWNFIVWGLLNFAVLMISEEFEPAYERFHAAHSWANGKAYHLFMVLRTFLLICVLNMFDCYASVGETLGAIASMFTSRNWDAVAAGGLLEIGVTAADYLVLAVAAAFVLCVSLYRNKNGDPREVIAAKPFEARFAIWFGLFVVVLIFGAYGIGYDASQFIYNRF